MTDFYETTITRDADEKIKWCWDNLDRKDWFVSSRIGSSVVCVFSEDAAMAYKLRWT